MGLPKYSMRKSSPAQTSESASPPAYTPMAPYTPMVPGRSSRNFFANMDAPLLMMDLNQKHLKSRRGRIYGKLLAPDHDSAELLP
jgi:hypothetical protein